MIGAQKNGAAEAAPHAVPALPSPVLPGSALLRTAPPCATAQKGA
jgi:hypothetical protein